MPTTTLPAAGYLGDPNRRTDEFQQEINKVVEYCRELNSEKLSTTGKAADSNLLDGLDSTAYVRKTDIDLSTSQLVWSGSQHSVASTSMNGAHTGPGVYLFTAEWGQRYVYVWTGGEFELQTAIPRSAGIEIQFIKGSLSSSVYAGMYAAGSTGAYQQVNMKSIYRLRSL